MTLVVLKHFACRAAPLTPCGRCLFAKQLTRGRTQWFPAQRKGPQPSKEGIKGRESLPRVEISAYGVGGRQVSQLKKPFTSGENFFPAPHLFPSELYQRFPDVFVPYMFSALQHFLRNKRVSDAWSVSLMPCIPKFAQASKAKDVRSITLQNGVMKWMSPAMLLQVLDVFEQIIPPSQKGIMKGLRISGHVLQAKMEREVLGEYVMVAVDFQKAYDSVSF